MLRYGMEFGVLLSPGIYSCMLIELCKLHTLWGIVGGIVQNINMDMDINSAYLWTWQSRESQ